MALVGVYREEEKRKARRTKRAETGKTGDACVLIDADVLTDNE
jgi:hypothetical protein